MPLNVHGLDHLVLNVRDVAVSAAWYEAVLGTARHEFDPGHGKAVRTSIAFGTQKINLRPVEADTDAWFTARHPKAGSDDLCFLTETSPDAVAAHLGANGVVIEEGPTQKQGARGTLRSVYCRDPDGNLIEIASYAD